jgi:hydroxylysine kinase
MTATRVVDAMPSPIAGEASAPPPQLAPRTAAAIAREVYGVEGTASVLAGERDRNFRIDATDGRAFVLKMSHPAESGAITAFQRGLLRHLETLSSPCVPRICLTLESEDGYAFDVGGVTMAVQMITFIDGIGLHATPGSAAQARNLGTALARLDGALENFAHPAAHRDLLWDVGKAHRLRNIVGLIGEPAERRLVSEALDSFEDRCLPVLPQLRHQIIHNDFNPHNVLMEGDAPDRVAGIIDFGDALYAPLINELATALSYHVHDRNDPLRFAAELTASFHTSLPLYPEEIDLLFDLIVARLAIQIAISNWRAAHDAANAGYLRRNTARTRQGLVNLSAIGREDATARLAANLSGVRP